MIYSSLGIVLKLNGNDATTDDFTNHEDIRMYQCKSGDCQMISGYTKVNGNYYKVTTTGGATEVDNSAPTGGCKKNNIGLVYKDTDTKFYICLDKNLAVELAEGHYILGDGTGVGPFDGLANKLVIIDENKANIYVDTEFKGKLLTKKIFEVKDII